MAQQARDAAAVIRAMGDEKASVFGNSGGDGLLVSYEAERRPVAERTIREATANMSVLAPELGNQELVASGLVGEQARHAAARAIRAAKDREFHSLGLVLGYQYDASPVIVDDGTPPLSEGQNYEPTARPGARLPHLWQPDGVSLYDRLGKGLSLLLASHSSFHCLPLFIISRKTISPKMPDTMRFTIHRRERCLMSLSFLWYSESKAPTPTSLRVCSPRGWKRHAAKDSLCENMRN
jgi:pimeloyl-ACP methyl ester carboxylesterase